MARVSLASLLACRGGSLVVGCAFVAVACAFRGFDSPVRNPMLFGAPGVWAASAGNGNSTSLSRTGLARACAFFSFVEHLTGTAIVGAVVVVALRGWSRLPATLRGFTWREWFSLAYLSVGGSALGLYFFLLSMTLGKPVVAILIQQLQPLVTVAAAALLLRERPTKYFAIPAVLSLAGILLIAVPDLVDAARGSSSIKPATGGAAVLSDLFSLIAAVLWGASTVFGRQLSSKMPFWDLVFLRYCGGFLFSVVFAACNWTLTPSYLGYLFEGSTHVYGYISPETGLPVRAYWEWHTIGCVFFCTLATGGVIPLALYYFGLRMGPAAVAGLCELTFPAVSIFVNAYWLNYRLTAFQIGGAACVMVSVLAVTALSIKKKATVQTDADVALPTRSPEQEADEKKPLASYTDAA
eukprot:m51a1_g14532 hypothetical protein (410) ;mRNA; r:940053-941413